MQIGIDPTGGINPYSPSIVWSGYKNPFDAYQQFSVSVQAQGDSVTVFTFSAPSVNPNSPEYGFKHTDIYWDDASLVIVGGGSAPPPSQPPTEGDSGSATGSTTTTQPYVPFPTSTPDAEGVIYAEVQSGDSLWAISARAGLTIAELLEINDITEDHVIRAGDLLVTGHGDPPGEEEAAASETSADGSDEVESKPTPLPTQPPIPTETGPVVAVQETGGGTICLAAFDDTDQDTKYDESESLRSAVAITISDGEQVVSNYITDGETEPFCIQGLKTGNYRITRSSLPNETLTTPGDYAVALTEGTAVDIEFGSYISEDMLASSVTVDGSSDQGDAEASGEGAVVEDPNDPLSNLLIIGVVVAVLLLAGIVILVMSKRRTTTEE
jgi:LysM repeat protein